MECNRQHDMDKDAYFYFYLDRTIRMIGKEAVDMLRTKRVVIAGCGGVGGAACITLARMGVGEFILADPGKFDEPDINRQMGAVKENLGRNKAQVYEEILQTINPDITVKKYSEGVTNNNILEIIEGADMVIDCLDIAVPPSLRRRVYQLSWEKGIPAIVAPVIGFGCIIAISSPGVVPLTSFGNVLDKAAESAKLPDVFWDVFVPEHLEALGKSLEELKAPTIAVSVQLATSIVCTEAVLFLAKNFPGWRPPVCLPKTIVVDLLRMNFRVLDIDEYGENYKKIEQDSGTSPAHLKRKSQLLSQEYEDLLSSVNYNTNLLPANVIRIDMQTDSWREINGQVLHLQQKQSPKIALTDKLRELYGYNYVIPVSQGRFAEALLAKAAIQTGYTVLTNSLFPTTRFHLESNGAKIINLCKGNGYDFSSADNFKGDLPLDSFKKALTETNINIIYLELCNNATGGHPISLRNLKEIYKLASAKGVLVFLDATRAFENACLIREREQGYSGKKLVEIVRELSFYSHACTASLSKDFVSPIGGFIATNNEHISNSVQDLAALAYGNGLPEKQYDILADQLTFSPESDNSVKGRIMLVEKLWKSLHALCIPVVEPAGGHAVFLDATKFLQHIPATQHPAQALVNAIYIAGGIRSSVNLITPEQKSRNVQLVRLAVPINHFAETDIEEICNVIKNVFENRERISGLKQCIVREGLGGEFTAQYLVVSKKISSSPEVGKK